MLTVLSLGAGVQSSTLALMAAAGEVPMPEAAIFADTGAEPQAVYDWLDWLEKQLPFPVYRVQQGNLAVDQVTVSNSKDGTPYLRNMIPAFVKNNDGSQGMLLRKCTADYKLSPIRRKARALMLDAGLKSLTLWIGISLDEAHRMKPSGVKYITNHYPLVERGITRWHCLAWMKAHGHQEPPKSACTFCPYHSNEQWKSLAPDEFAQAVAFERKWNELARGDQRSTQVRGEIFLHRSMVPLDQVDLRSAEDAGQGALFGNDCEGMCGV